MDRAKMITTFRELYNLSSHTNDGKEDDEIDVYLNLAQDEIIDRQFDEKEGGLMQLKQSSKAIDNIRTLMTTDSPNAFVLDGQMINAKTFSLDDAGLVPVRYVTGVKAQIADVDNGSSTSWFRCLWIPPSDAWKYQVNDENSPIINNPLFTILENKVFVISEEVARKTINNAILEYIKEPNVIGVGVNSNLPSHTHSDLVEVAVNLALKSSSVEPVNKVQIDMQEDSQ